MSTGESDRSTSTHSDRSELKSVGIRLSAANYRLVQILAVRDGVSIARLCEDVIEVALRAKSQEIREAAQDVVSQVLEDLEVPDRDALVI